MGTNPRAAQLADQIHEVLARYLARRAKDPRLAWVTITDVRVTGDLREATVWYTALSGAASADPAEVDADAAAALASARGLLRSVVGKQLGLKFAPTLAFVRDATAETAADMEALLAQAAAADAALAAGRDESKYAGDPDPYKHPEDEAE
jgi:ribosome-binding factor A